jgi:hypothetical protein
LEDIEHTYLNGVEQSPKSVHDTYHHVTNWSNGPRNVMNIIGPTNDGLSFAQAVVSNKTNNKNVIYSTQTKEPVY